MADDDDADLFDYAHARPSDPATSHEAVPVNLSEQAWRVLQAYKCDRPLLDHDASRLVGHDCHQRCSDLRAVGFIERTGERAMTPSRKAGYVCRITPAGWSYLRGRE